MAAQTNSLNVHTVLAAALGLMAVALVLLVLSGRTLPLITDDRGALIALGVIGFAMCTLAGSGRVPAAIGWGHPISIVGALLGVAALLVITLPLINVKLPGLATDRSAFIALAVIMLVKIGLSGLSRFIA